MPTPVPNLKAVLSYYSSTVSINPEGDVHISNETVQGLGRRLFPTSLFGSLNAIINPPTPRPSKQRSPNVGIRPHISQQESSKAEPHLSSFLWNLREQANAEHPNTLSHTFAIADPIEPSRAKLLTDLLPDPGYFLAGGIAGVVSRTVTAPLDRLKVYLIAHVDVKEAVDNAKSGDTIKAAKMAGRPLIDAAKTLWRIGGVRSMFAGIYFLA